MIELKNQNRPRVPDAVYDLAIRLGVKPQDKSSRVHLTQTGRMKQNLGSAAWMAFTATQTLSTHSCDFDWRARAGPFGMISARDALEGGEGRFDIMALGFIPIARAPHTAALVRGELMRYLAELAWAPDAILANASLRWRIQGEDKLVVSAGDGDSSVDVFLTLDDQGHIVEAFAPDRPRSSAKPILPTPWRGRFMDYRLHSGRWLPFAAEVAWEIDGKLVVYWQAEMAHWELEDRVNERVTDRPRR